MDQQLASGISDSAYVEIASLVCLIRVVDTFRKGVGLPELAEPDPLPGDPSGYRPPSAADEGAFVPMIPINGLNADTSDLFNPRAFVPNVQRAFSLVPDSTRLANQLMQSHYLDYQSVTQYTDDDHDRLISKSQMELVSAFSPLIGIIGTKAPSSATLGGRYPLGSPGSGSGSASSGKPTPLRKVSTTRIKQTKDAIST